MDAARDVMLESWVRRVRAVDIADSRGNLSLAAPGAPIPTNFPCTEAMSSSSKVSTSRSWQSDSSTSFCFVDLAEN